MESLSNLIDIHFDHNISKSLDELESKFEDKKEQLLLIQDKPNSSKYKQLLQELKENVSKREAIILRS